MPLFKISVYFLWFLFITFCMANLHQIGLDTNTQGARCDIELWRDGLPYQWIWEGKPCIYTGDFLFGYYFYLLLYLLFDIVRRRIIGANPTLRWRLTESGVWFLLNWSVLLWLSATTGISLSVTMIIASFVGTALFFLPLIVISVAAKFLTPCIELGIFIALLAPVFLLFFL